MRQWNYEQIRTAISNRGWGGDKQEHAIMAELNKPDHPTPEEVREAMARTNSLNLPAEHDRLVYVIRELVYGLVGIAGTAAESKRMLAAVELARAIEGM